MNPILVRIIASVAIHVAIDNYHVIKKFAIRKHDEHKVRKAFKEQKPHETK